MHFMFIVTPLPLYCSSAPRAHDLCAKLPGMCPGRSFPEFTIGSDRCETAEKRCHDQKTYVLIYKVMDVAEWHYGFHCSLTRRLV